MRRFAIAIVVGLIALCGLPPAAQAAAADAIDPPRSDGHGAADLRSPTAAPQTFDVTDFGARADGLMDDVPAIKAATAAAVAAGGGTVYLPAGTYRLVAHELIDDPDAPLQVHLRLEEGVTYKGDGIGQTVLVMAGPSYASGFGSSRGSDLHVQDLTITADHETHAFDGDGIKLQGVTDSSFTNVWAENQYIAFAVIGCSRVRLTGCVAMRTSLNFSISVADAFPRCANILVDGCRSFESEQCGFWAYHDQGDNSSRVRSVIFRDCYAAGNAGAGFYTKWSDSTAFVDCTSFGNAWGFYVLYARNFVVAGCAARGNKASNALPYNAGHSSRRLTPLFMILSPSQW